jgi:isopenicillin N synthase-like dioxygenase
MQQPNNDEHEVQLVDFSAFMDNSDKQTVSDAILSSFKSIGFVYITNHGMPDEIVQNMFKWVLRPQNS